MPINKTTEYINYPDTIPVSTDTGDQTLQSALNSRLPSSNFNDFKSDLTWLAQPIGVPFPIRDDLTGISTPPTDNTDFRYIKLTASDAYNTGILISESVSGSAPLVVATAVIDYVDSPINGETVNLWNTEGRYGKPGTSSGAVANDKMQQITGSYSANRLQQQKGNGLGVFTDVPDSGTREAPAGTGTNNTQQAIAFDSSLSPGARTGDSTDVKHQQVTYYMRIA